MVFGSGNNQYHMVQEVYHGKINDVAVCQDLQAAGTSYKTVWFVKDRNAVRLIIKLFHTQLRQSKIDTQTTEIYENCFPNGDEMCFIFPYERERPLEKFYLATIKNGMCDGSQIWMQLVMKCMTSCLPVPILYLILEERKIKLGQDGSIYFQYDLNLEYLDEKKTIQDCVAECARIICGLMEQETDSRTAAELLEHRLMRRSYTKFIDLYKDIHLVAQQKETKSGKKGIAKVLGDKKDFIYKALVIISFILLVITGVLILGKIVFGDFSIYRLFWHSIKQIGTESLLQ